MGMQKTELEMGVTSFVVDWSGRGRRGCGVGMACRSLLQGDRMLPVLAHD